MWAEKTLNGILPHLYEVFIVLQDLHLLIILYSDANFLTFAGHKEELFCKYFNLVYLDFLEHYILISFWTFVQLIEQKSWAIEEKSLASDVFYVGR